MTTPTTIVPISRTPLAIRPATMEDVPFMDALQKQGNVLIAEERHEGTEARRHEGEEEGAAPCPPSVPPCLRAFVPSPLGYCIDQDQYFKRDDVGIIYQMNVVPGKQRSLIGATLLKGMFERAAYGCRLFCCWCAQDIAANRFWEALGFVPLAFRSGSAKKSRTHIFWQKRIRSGDTTTPYWFPAQTTSGSIREDRIVLPIPPGTHWSDAKPIVLPEEKVAGYQLLVAGEEKAARRRSSSRLPATHNQQLATPSAAITSGGLWFVAAKGPVSEPKPKREPKPKVKNDPRLIAAARELRDRYLEEINSGRLLQGGSQMQERHGGVGKYDVSRQLQAVAKIVRAMPLLPAA